MVLPDSDWRPAAAKNFSLAPSACTSMVHLQKQNLVHHIIMQCNLNSQAILEGNLQLVASSAHLLLSFTLAKLAGH